MRVKYHLESDAISFLLFLNAFALLSGAYRYNLEGMGGEITEITVCFLESLCIAFLRGGVEKTEKNSSFFYPSQIISSVGWGGGEVSLPPPALYVYDCNLGPAERIARVKGHYLKLLVFRRFVNIYFRLIEFEFEKTFLINFDRDKNK